MLVEKELPFLQVFKLQLIRVVFVKCVFPGLRLELVEHHLLGVFVLFICSSEDLLTRHGVRVCDCNSVEVFMDVLNVLRVHYRSISLAGVTMSI